MLLLHILTEQWELRSAELERFQGSANADTFLCLCKILAVTLQEQGLTVDLSLIGIPYVCGDKGFFPFTEVRESVSGWVRCIHRVFDWRIPQWHSCRWAATYGCPKDMDESCTWWRIPNGFCPWRYARWQAQVLSYRFVSPKRRTIISVCFLLFSYCFF